VKWFPAKPYAQERYRLIHSEDYSQIYAVSQPEDGYEVRYREGRFGPSAPVPDDQIADVLNRDIDIKQLLEQQEEKEEAKVSAD
jgi:topoisomerase IA-like protein